MAAEARQSVASQRSLRTWLLNPFHYVAGGTALVVGLVAIVAASLVGSVSDSHFDGVLDFHTGAKAPLRMFLAEGAVDWLALAIPLWLGGMLISRSRVRPLDVFGTQALARLPTVVTALFALLPGYRRFALHLASQFTKGVPDVQTHAADPVVFALVVVVMLVMTVWMVALMYRAFAVSCNVKGGKAIGIFIAAVVLGEVLSKVAILGLLAVSRGH